MLVTMPRMMLSRMKNTSVTTRACFESPPLAAGMGGTSREQELLAREAYHRGRERDALTANREGQPGEYRAKGCRLFRIVRVFLQCKRCASSVNAFGRVKSDRAGGGEGRREYTRSEGGWWMVVGEDPLA